MTSSERVTKKFEFTFRDVAIDCATKAMADKNTEDVQFETSPWIKDGESGRYSVLVRYFKTESIG